MKSKFEIDEKPCERKSQITVEKVGFALAIVATLRLEFLREPLWLARMLTWSSYTFCMLSFGLWLTDDFNGAFQHFCYFSGTIAMLFFTKWSSMDFIGNASTP